MAKWQYLFMHGGWWEDCTAAIAARLGDRGIPVRLIGSEEGGEA